MVTKERAKSTQACPFRLQSRVRNVRINDQPEASSLRLGFEDPAFLPLQFMVIRAAVADQAADKWEQRRQESLEKKYTDGEQYEDQGKKMRIFPITEVRRVVEVDETGRETQVQIIKPARLPAPSRVVQQTSCTR